MNAFYGIWLAGISGMVVVLVLLSYRRIWRTLPIFFAYCIWDLTANLVTGAASRFYPQILFHVYFTQVIIDSAFQFCVLVELAWSVLRPLRASLPRTTPWLIGILILVAGAAIWPFANLSSLAQVTTREGQLFFQLQQTVSILRILFFLLLAGGSQLLSIGWRDRELQVATGFGVYSMVGLAVAVMQTHLTTAAQYQHLGEVVAGAYCVSLLYWVFCFAQKEAERREFTPQMQRFLLAVAGAARSARVGLEDAHGPKSRKPDGR
jgi:hypothetical protein